MDWTSGNEKIDDFIQEMQLTINVYDDKVLEWIPYNQFNDIKEIGKDSSAIVYSAIWIYGPLNYDKDDEVYKRNQYENVSLRCLHNSQNIISEFLFKAKSYPIENYHDIKIYGISQNLDTKDYIMVFNDGYCEKCGELYTNVDKKCIKVIGKGAVYSAIWVDGPLDYNYDKKLFVKSYSINKNNDDILHIYGISQNLSTKNYIIVLKDEYCEKCGEQYTDIVFSDIIFEWIPYNQFENVKEIGEGGFAKIYSAIWTDGPLYYDEIKKVYKRNQNTKIALKCLCNSQNISDEFLNEV
ncbi:hypothetical protein C1645_830937 [Glomus cerebriforme]|uniref:Protein kinase domain-containing protein n=1 Tax=Glomus cerebriforme TaxID=658196 RepID=A0A397SGH2_9GLOM|nr:hypothetical protein C1645_830937 [Glomus cerebriforme]